MAWWEVLVGLALGLAFAAFGHRGRLLTRSGGAGVVGVTALAFGAGGWEWGTVMALHLLSAGLWTRYRAAAKEALSQRHERPGPLGLAPVVARTGWATLLALVRWSGAGGTVIYGAYVGALAAATADRWGTEVGLLSAQPPRLITTRARAVPGAPGAVSPLGLVAALGGTWLVGLAALGTGVLSAWIEVLPYDRGLLWLPLAAVVAGLGASLVDSLLGATAQVVYYCATCDRSTEDPDHCCQEEAEPAQRVRGVSWLTDEMVDLVGSLVGAALAAVLIGALGGL